jgi:hypothetical protein
VDMRKVFGMSRELRRPLYEEEPTAEPGRYGCPMLSRLRLASTFDAGGPTPWRCSLGWAVRGEEDAARCNATESVGNCWKVHPERAPVAVLPVADVQEMKIGAD